MEEKPPLYWVSGSGGQTFGPADLGTLQQWVRESRVAADTMLTDASTGESTRADRLIALRPLFSAPEQQPWAMPSSSSALPRQMYPAPARWSNTAAIVLAITAVVVIIAVVSTVAILKSLVQPAAPAPGVPRETAMSESRPLMPVPGMRGQGQIVLVPLGGTNPDLVKGLAKYYEQRLGLKMRVMPANTLAFMNKDHERGQYAAEDLIEMLKRLYRQQPASCVIGIVDSDIYSRDTPAFTFIFGQRQGGQMDGAGVISTARFNPNFFGERPDPKLVYSRVRKLTTKYIGTLYYGLPESTNPESVLYGPVVSLDELDRMGQGF